MCVWGSTSKNECSTRTLQEIFVFVFLLSFKSFKSPDEQLHSRLSASPGMSSTGTGNHHHQKVSRTSAVSCFARPSLQFAVPPGLGRPDPRDGLAPFTDRSATTLCEPVSPKSEREGPAPGASLAFGTADVMFTDTTNRQWHCSTTLLGAGAFGDVYLAMSEAGMPVRPRRPSLPSLRLSRTHVSSLPTPPALRNDGHPLNAHNSSANRISWPAWIREQVGHELWHMSL